MVKIDNLEQNIVEECPYFSQCPVGDSDYPHLDCHRFYIDCPRFIEYIKKESKEKK